MGKKTRDTQIIEGILARDETALRTFYRSHAPRLLRYVSKRVPQQEDAEEIVQDTLLACLESFRDFTYQSSLSTYVYAIAKRKVADWYRRKKLSRIVFSQMPGFERLLESLLTPEEELDRIHVQLAIERAFSQLAPLQQTLLRLKYIEGLSVGEIAVRLAITFKSAESALFRARRAFAKAYAYQKEQL